MHAARLCQIFVLLAFVAGACGAQVQPGHAVIASNVGGATRLFDLDLATGAHVALPAFPGSGRLPLALAVDPVSRDLFVVVDAGAGRSTCFRVRYTNARLVSARTVATFTGLVRALLLGAGADLVMADAMGVSRLARFGAPSRVANIARASALSTWDAQSPQAWVAESGSGSTPPGLRLIDLASGRTLSGPHRYAGFTPNLTGVVDLPTGLIRQLVTDSLGRISVSIGFKTPVPLKMTPVLPSGGTRCLRYDFGNLDAYVLGGRSHPYLKTMRGWVGQAWKIRGGPFPGDPVAFDLGPGAGPSVVPFGRGCGHAGAQHPFAIRANGAPKLGNASFALVATQAPLAFSPIVVLIGATEIPHATLPAPCLLRVAPDLIFGHVTDRASGASQTIAIPADTRFHGATFYAQWVQPRLTATVSFASSNAAACHVR